MSEKTETKEAAAELPPAPEPTSETPKKSKKCVQSPTKEHDMFHNEGTDETYCRYCGKTE